LLLLVAPFALGEDCLKPCDSGALYSGNWSTTVSGRTCQTWAKDSPHSHNYNDQEENFCRNPSKGTGPWCYTTDPDKRWEYCDVPICEDTSTPRDVGCLDEDDFLGTNYTGGRTTTRSGRTCQHWCSDSPHSHSYNDGGEGNFCRNPSSSNGGPWCYTTDPDKRWEYCDIPTCPKDPSAPTCRNWGKGQGVEYRGTVSVTQTGAACEKWSEADLGNWGYGEMGKWRWSHNFCRNPNKQDRGPWCYVPGTKDSYYIGRQGWDYCTVPYCEGEDKGKENPDMYYCEFWPGHTMCKYPGPTEECAKKEALTDDDRAELVKIHNDRRRRIAKGEEPGQPPAANMMEMVWDKEMEAIAQRWTDQCDFGHDSNRKLLDGSYCGQNAASGYSTSGAAVQGWYSEVENMEKDCVPSDSKSCSVDKFGSGISTGTVGHYTQVVWATSSRLGCGRRGRYVVCNYLGGNMSGASIYKRGEACSACPEGTTCADGLCRAETAP